jgi:hypothetical protein
MRLSRFAEAGKVVEAVTRSVSMSAAGALVAGELESEAGDPEARGFEKAVGSSECCRAFG